jgi:hypothetical protein
MNNSLSEHIGCKIFRTVGIPVQDTLIGEDGEDILVACRDFVDRESGFELHEFSTISKEMYASSDVGRYPSIEKIYEVIDNSAVLENIQQEAKDRFWEMQIVDALIGNFDRHTGNWGYIVNTRVGMAKLAPIYDNGSSLWPKIEEGSISEILSSKNDMRELIYNLPSGHIRFNENGKVYSWLEAFGSNLNKDCFDALIRIIPRIDIEKICSEVDNTPLVSSIRKEFYKAVIKERFENILLKSLEVIKLSFPVAETPERVR